MPLAQALIVATLAFFATLIIFAGYLTYALSYLVASGGTAGYSLRMLLIERRSLPIKHVLATSLFLSTLNNLPLFAWSP